MRATTGPGDGKSINAEEEYLWDSILAGLIVELGWVLDPDDDYLHKNVTRFTNTLIAIPNSLFHVNLAFVGTLETPPHIQDTRHDSRNPRVRDLK